MLRFKILSRMAHFKTNFISCSRNDDSIQKQFIKTSHYYDRILSRSIKYLELGCKLKTKKHKFYNYLLIDARALYNLLDDISGLPTLNDLVLFKSTIIYIGKGCKNRKNAHFLEIGKMLAGGNRRDVNLPSRLKNILNIWSKGCGVIVLEFLSNSNNYVSLCRENAMIHAAGVHLTNLIKGTAYGAMKTSWTKTDVVMFGDALLFSALQKCIKDKPKPLMQSDFVKPKKYIFNSYYELKGIIDCFLEM